MKFLLYLQAAVLLIFSGNAIALQPKIEIVEQFDNLRVVAFVDADDVAATPEWNPNLSPIPLTVGQAIQAVKDFNHGPEAIAAIREIEIRKVPGHESRWHYLIRISNAQLKTKYDIYVVLMNGKVIPGIIKLDGYR